MQEEQKPDATPENEQTHSQQTEQQADSDHADAQPEDSNLAEAELAQLQEQVATLKNQVIRERADNDNLRKRQERELQGAHKFATERLIKDLLPVLDSLTLGLDAAKNNEDKPEAIAQFIEGSEMTLKLLSETLTKHGIEEISPEGEKFDPEQHEAVAALPNDEVAANTILHVAQKGYSLNGRVVRAAQVVVAKGSGTN